MSLVVLLVVSCDWPKNFACCFRRSEAAGMVCSSWILNAEGWGATPRIG